MSPLSEAQQKIRVYDPIYFFSLFLLSFYSLNLLFLFLLLFLSALLPLPVLCSLFLLSCSPLSFPDWACYKHRYTCDCKGSVSHTWHLYDRLRNFTFENSWEISSVTFSKLALAISSPRVNFPTCCRGIKRVSYKQRIIKARKRKVY